MIGKKHIYFFIERKRSIFDRRQDSALELKKYIYKYDFATLIQIFDEVNFENRLSPISLYTSLDI